jgi:hypothetical protein
MGRASVVYAEVACSGRLFVDRRGVRAERIHMLRPAAFPSAWPDPHAHAEAVTALRAARSDRRHQRASRGRVRDDYRRGGTR